MKCQRCQAKTATLHITEVLPQQKYEELHFCEECSKKHFDSAPGKKAAAEVDPNSRQCQQCGIKFVEFRNTGRLGCGHDYDHFSAELIPLLESIHGEILHAGKKPRRGESPPVRNELAALKRQLKDAVDEEAYETAARLRDRIRQMEEAAVGIT